MGFCWLMRAKGEGCLRNVPGTMAMVIWEWRAVSGDWSPGCTVAGGGMRQVGELLQRQAETSRVTGDVEACLRIQELNL